jgi:hypothetical protein
MLTPAKARRWNVELELRIAEWDRKRCRGMMDSFVARGTGDPDIIAKSIQSTVENGHLNRVVVDLILSDIDRETVRPFLSGQWSRPERLERFRALKDSLQDKLS